MTDSHVLDDAIGRQQGDTLYMTRKARGSARQGPEVGSTQSPKNGEPFDNVTGPPGGTTKGRIVRGRIVRGRNVRSPTPSQLVLWQCQSEVWTWKEGILYRDKTVTPDATPILYPIHRNSVNNVISSPSPFATSEPETRKDDFYAAARNQRRQSQEPPHSPREPAYRVHQEPETPTRQMVDLSGPRRYFPPGPSRTPFEFQVVQSRPFVEPANQRRPSSQSLITAPPHHQTLPVDTDGAFEKVPLSYKSESLTQLKNDVNDVPQSRTFKILESIMSNEEPASGAAGLPPPRSAAMERMKREGSGGAGSSPRVKVLMSQKYNSPLGMYSAKNFIETFAVQAENALETLEKQNPALPEHEPVYASRH